MVATPDPTTGTTVSTSAWGHDVYLDLSRLSNLGVFASAGGCSLATTSASYVDITNASLSWTKLGGATDTDILVAVAISMYSATSGTTAGKVGINIGGTDTDVILTWHSAASTIQGSYVGFKKITGVAAGALTPKLRALRTSGSGTLTVDSLVNVAFLVGEVPK